jgi:hypothetical protein
MGLYFRGKTADFVLLQNLRSACSDLWSSAVVAMLPPDVWLVELPKLARAVMRRRMADGCCAVKLLNLWHCGTLISDISFETFSPED